LVLIWKGFRLGDYQKEFSENLVGKILAVVVSDYQNSFLKIWSEYVGRFIVRVAARLRNFRPGVYLGH